MGAQKNQQTSVRSYKRIFLHKKGLQEMLRNWSLNLASLALVINIPFLTPVFFIEPAVFREWILL